MRQIVGFDRRIKQHWLDALLDRVAVETEKGKLRSFVNRLLSKDHPGSEARGKTATVLMRTWVLVPPRHQDIRQEALRLLPSIPSQDRIWLHWGMMLLAYPFFRDSAGAMRRLLKFQDDFTLLQLQRRLIERWGDRSTVKRASQRIVRSMVDWGVLLDAPARGHFQAAEQPMAGSKATQLWLLQAALVAESAEVLESKQLLNLPTLFPFKIAVALGDIRRSKSFTTHRQGLNMEMVGVHVPHRS
jgi:hypothetical protein